MPLIRCDYAPDLIDSTKLHQLMQLMLKESCRIFNSELEAMSFFTKPFESPYYSSVAIEIEIRAKVSEFDNRAPLSRNEVRQQFLDGYTAQIETFITENDIPKGVVCSITFEDWQVAWLPGKEQKHA